MKALIVLMSLTLSGLSFAQGIAVVRLTNIGNAVNVEIPNTNLFAINCSGMVYMHSFQGVTDSQYYNSRILAGLTAARTLWLFRPNDTVQYSNHSIYCSQAK